MSTTVYLTVFDRRRGIDEGEDDAAGYVSETGPPPLWAGLIPSDLAAEHLAKTVAEWDEWTIDHGDDSEQGDPADDAGGDRAAADHGTDDGTVGGPDGGPGSPEDDRLLLSGPTDEGGGFLVIPWTAARDAYRERLDSFGADQPALAAQAREWIAALEPVVDAAAAKADGVDHLWVELDYSLLHDDCSTSEEYVETMGKHLAPWVWPGQGLAKHLQAMGDDAARGESWDEKFEREARAGVVSAGATASGSAATPSTDAVVRYLPLIPLWLIGGWAALGTRGAVRIAILAGLIALSVVVTAPPRHRSGVSDRHPQRPDGPRD